MAADIEKKLAEAGYRMLGNNESIEEFILDILKTKNIRYLKAIPFLIYKYKPDIARIGQHYMGDFLFRAIITITSRLFTEFRIMGILPEYEEGSIERYGSALKQFGLDYDEFKGEFESQLRKETGPPLFIEKQKIYAERDLQMYLSELFTKKEKWIIGRLLEEKPISRTDYEYYSRKTRKKLGSIIGLQDFAKALCTKTPKYDEELFNLKKKFERWLEDLDIKGAEILKFSIFDNDKISISYKEEGREDSNDQIFNIIKRLKEIKDKEILNLLNIYKEHNFR